MEDVKMLCTGRKRPQQTDVKFVLSAEAQSSSTDFHHAVSISAVVCETLQLQLLDRNVAGNAVSCHIWKILALHILLRLSELFLRRALTYEWWFL